MRGRSSSSKQNTKTEMEIDKIDKLKNEPHLSGAYIRSLVKQLTSSRPKDPLNPNKDQHESNLDGEDLGKIVVGFSENQPPQQPQPPPPPPQQHKKQVRRRLHTTRPYQERLLNMAEARREIVTALKFHRASMKQQANEQQQQQQQQESRMEVESSHPSSLLDGKTTKSRRNQRVYATNYTTNNFSNFMENFSSSSSLPYPSFNPYDTWQVSQFSSPLVQEDLNFALPNQTLGLNLNFQDFTNLDTTFYQTSHNPSIYSSSSSPSTSSPPPISEIPSMAIPPQQVAPMAAANVEGGLNGGDLGLHPAMDDKEIAEIRSIGEQHQMEWNDTLNLVTSAWWFKFLKTTELGPEEKKAEDDLGCFPFDEVMEFPAWLNPNESCMEQNFQDYSSDDYLQDPALPCMDIGEIEGMDGDWLA